MPDATSPPPAATAKSSSTSATTSPPPPTVTDDLRNAIHHHDPATWAHLESRQWVQIGWRTPVVIATSAVIRGTYHLYQGFGGFIGNAVMGVVLGWVHTRTRRVMPLVVAHTILDIVAFVGHALLRERWGWL